MGDGTAFDASSAVSRTNVISLPAKASHQPCDF